MKADIFELMEEMGHEALIFCLNEPTSLRAIIAIHDATLGPAMGGTRMWDYPSEDAALRDVLSLSRSMTFQTAIGGNDFGGGKAVIWGKPREEKNEALLRAYGRFVQGLGGRFVTFADLGTGDADLAMVGRETGSVVAIKLRSGETVNSAQLTAWAAYWGIKACAKEVYGVSSLANLHIGVLGVGAVGGGLVDLFRQEKARLTITDINYDAIKIAQDRHQGVAVATPEGILRESLDILVPCALGGIITHEDTPYLKCRILAGPASNVLEQAKDADDLHERGVLYIPAYALNAGGTATPHEERQFATVEEMLAWARRSYDIVAHVMALARRSGIPPYQAAQGIARERIERIGEVRRILC
jgi:leucine dehydrogenase